MQSTGRVSACAIATSNRRSFAYTNCSMSLASWPRPRGLCRARMRFIGSASLHRERHFVRPMTMAWSLYLPRLRIQSCCTTESGSRGCTLRRFPSRCSRIRFFRYLRRLPAGIPCRQRQRPPRRGARPAVRLASRHRHVGVERAVAGGRPGVVTQPIAERQWHPAKRRPRSRGGDPRSARRPAETPPTLNRPRLPQSVGPTSTVGARHSHGLAGSGCF